MLVSLALIILEIRSFTQGQGYGSMKLVPCAVPGAVPFSLPHPNPPGGFLVEITTAMTELLKLSMALRITFWETTINEPK